MEGLVAGDLKIDCSDEAGAIVLKWRGRSVDRSPTRILTPFVHGIFETAKAQTKPVEMRFEGLEHFNSSTITALIQLIQEARKRGLRLILVYDEALKWQRLSFDALRVFEADDALVLKSV